MEIELMKRGAKALTFGKDRAPAQARLEALQREFFEHAIIIILRKTPFRIMIGQEFRHAQAPLASQVAVWTR